MTRILAAAMLAAMLGGCAPFAIFANGSGPAYDGLRSDWGTYVASREVNAFCMTPSLRLAIWDFEGHFGRKIVLDSGYRDFAHNAAAGGVSDSYHRKCMAADFYIPGVPKQDLIAFAMREGLVGGLGCYPGQAFIHIDVRDRPRGANGPVLFRGCVA